MSLAIFIAAGRGSRLSPYTDGIPKCMVAVNDTCMIQRQMSILRGVGVDRFLFITGYLSDVLQAEVAGPDVKFVFNDQWESNNVLQSLFCATEHLKDATYIAYSDIIYTHGVAAALAASDDDIALVVDGDFRKTYEGRTEHPLSEAEVVAISDERIRTVGKRSVPTADAQGEFIGLLKLSKSGRETFAQHAQTLQAKLSLDSPYKRAKTFRQAYLSDFLQDLADSGHLLSPVLIQGDWREIDTVQDLKRAERCVSETPDQWL